MCLEFDDSSATWITSGSASIKMEDYVRKNTIERKVAQTNEIQAPTSKSACSTKQPNPLKTGTICEPRSQKFV